METLIKANFESMVSVNANDINFNFQDIARRKK